MHTSSRTANQECCFVGASIPRGWGEIRWTSRQQPTVHAHRSKQKWKTKPSTMEDSEGISFGSETKLIQSSMIQGELQMRRSLEAFLVPTLSAGRFFFHCGMSFSKNILSPSPWLFSVVARRSMMGLANSWPI